MVKIEKLSPDASVWFVRDGVRQRARLHQLLSRAELATLEVEVGTVVYSIDEQEVVTQSATTTKSPEPAAATAPMAAPAPVEPPVAPATETKPKVVFPGKSSKRK